jgi:hypothetical protein
MANIAVELLRSVIELTLSFGEIALMSPFQFVLLVVGGALTLLSVAAFGYLVLGAALEPLGVGLPSPGRRGPEE